MKFRKVIDTIVITISNVEMDIEASRMVCIRSGKERENNPRTIDPNIRERPMFSL
jgi:hypothetical protein